MNPELKMIPALYIIGILFGFIGTFCWIKKIRIKRRKNIQPGGKYSNSQIFGIIGIVVFLIPLFFVVISTLVRGAFFLLSMVSNLIQMPNSITAVIMNFLYPFSGILFTITGAYYFCSLVWPVKRPDA